MFIHVDLRQPLSGRMKMPRVAAAGLFMPRCVFTKAQRAVLNSEIASHRLKSNI
jgi:hypothetical protein